MRRARLTLAGNRWLAEAAGRAGGRAECFPTVVDTRRFQPAPRPGRAFRIGWIGSPSTTPDLESVAEVLRCVPSAETRLVGADPKTLHWPEAEVVPWSYDTEVELVQSFAVGVMPLRKTEWALGKCALKALLYMACGVPCVATPYGAACEIIEHGVNGLLADSPDEWREALERLRDPDYRSTLGNAARAAVEARFSLSAAAPRMAGLLESLA